MWHVQRTPCTDAHHVSLFTYLGTWLLRAQSPTCNIEPGTRWLFRGAPSVCFSRGRHHGTSKLEPNQNISCVGIPLTPRYCHPSRPLRTWLQIGLHAQHDVRVEVLPGGQELLPIIVGGWLGKTASRASSSICADNSLHDIITSTNRKRQARQAKRTSLHTASECYTS